jgi:hypothetical protein
VDTTITETPTFKEEQISAKMTENDVNNYLTETPDSLGADTVLDWLNENGDDRYEELLDQAGHDFLDEKIEELRQEAITELTDEWEQENLPASVFVARRRAELKGYIKDAEEHLSHLKQQLAEAV